MEKKEIKKYIRGVLEFIVANKYNRTFKNSVTVR